MKRSDEENILILAMDMEKIAGSLMTAINRYFTNLAKASNGLKKQQNELNEWLGESTSSNRERQIMHMRYGTGKWAGITHTLEEVAKEFGVTRERIRQIDEKVWRNIRKYQKITTSATSGGKYTADIINKL